MKKVALFLVVGGLFLFVSRGFAQNVTNTTETWKETLKSDREAIQTEKAGIKLNATEARSEEAALREQIIAAEQAGNTTQVQDLRKQLRALHEQNVDEKIADRKNLTEERKQLHEDVQSARAAGVHVPPPHHKP